MGAGVCTGYCKKRLADWTILILELVMVGIARRARYTPLIFVMGRTP